MGQKSRCGLVGSSASGSSTRMQPRCQPGPCCPLKAQLEKDVVRSLQVVDWIHFLEVFRTEDLSFLLSMWRKPSLFPCCVGFAIWWLTSSKLARKKVNKEFSSKMKVIILCNLTMEMTSHRLCHIFLVRSKSHFFPNIKGREWSRDINAKNGDNLLPPFALL